MNVSIDPGRALDRLVGPVPFVLGAFGHPLLQMVLLRGGEDLVRHLGRHRSCGRSAKIRWTISEASGVAGHDRRSRFARA